MSEQAVKAWVRILRDLSLVAVGAFILLHEEISAVSPNPYLIAAGLAALGLPPAIRLDYRRKENGDQ